MWYKYWYLTDRALKLGLLLPKLQKREFSRYFRAKYMYLILRIRSEQRKFLYGRECRSSAWLCAWLCARAAFVFHATLARSLEDY